MCFNPKALRVLIIDDEDLLLDLVTQQLCQLGVLPENVSTALDATAGLEKLCSQKNEIDLVVSDLDMPGMNGFMLLRTMRDKIFRDNPLFLMPFILMTGDTFASERTYALEPSAYLFKPFRINELQDTIKRIFSCSD